MIKYHIIPLIFEVFSCSNPRIALITRAFVLKSSLAFCYVFFRQFHQLFMSSFCADILSSKNYKNKAYVGKSFKKHFRTKIGPCKMLVKLIPGSARERKGWCNTSWWSDSWSKFRFLRKLYQKAKWVCEKNFNLILKHSSLLEQ